MSKRNLKARNLRPAHDPDKATEQWHQWLQSLHTDDIDGLTVPFQGASDVGVMPGPDTEPFTADNVREIGYRTWDLRPVPAADVLGIQQAPTSADTDPAPIADTIRRGFTHLFAIRCHFTTSPRPNKKPCAQEHADHDAGTFHALRMSAQRSGWHLDRLGRWCCQACQMASDYQTLYAPAVPAHGVTEVQAAEELLERTRLHYDASHRRGTHARQANKAATA